MKAFEKIPDWANGTNCAITVCDADCQIIYQNEKAKQTYIKEGDLIGKNLMECHGSQAQAIIKRLLSTGGTNAYTIEKGEVHKMIYQTAWIHENGEIGGLVEISMIIPAQIPHFVRKVK